MLVVWLDPLEICLNQLRQTGYVMAATALNGEIVDQFSSCSVSDITKFFQSNLSKEPWISTVLLTKNISSQCQPDGTVVFKSVAKCGF